MYNAKWILPGIVLFVALAASPFLYNFVSRAEAAPPQVTLPATEKQCVESAEFMRSEHMQLLVQWRDEVVRDGQRSYISRYSGKTFDKSLSGTCLAQCHTDKVEFCDRCHDYAAVSPDCWSCHVVPEVK